MLALLLSALVVWVADESDKVRPDARPPSQVAARVRLDAAGGECVGAQVVVRGPVRGLAARAEPLRSGVRTVPVSLARVATIRLVHPSGPDGATGEFPDALIPQRDAVYGEERRAFPVDVGDAAQAIFFEACPAPGAGPLRYAGSVHLSWKGGAQDVPVELRVRGFDLPATPALATAFGFSGYSAAHAHGRDASAARELTRAYDLLALRRGITLMGGTQDAPAHRFEGDELHIDWTSYDAEVAPFLDGTALPGARWTSVELREPARLTRPQRKAWRRAWEEHFRARGWLDRLYRYVEDEPDERALPAVEQKAREVKEDAPAVRRLVTTAAPLPSVDMNVALINCVAGKNPTCPQGAKAKIGWWYQSCMSHGCSKGEEPILDPAFKGWPSYMIDAPAMAARVMGTLAFENHIEGELYFDTVFAYDALDPWTNQWAFGGNGDGTLYYPGTPERIGGKHDVPVESLRLVQIARSLADYGYLTLCAQAGDPQLAQAEARGVARGVRSFSLDARAVHQMREHLAARIEALRSAHAARE